MKSFSLYIRVFKLIKPYWLLFLLAIVAMVLFTVANAALVYMVGPFLNTLFGISSGGALGAAEAASSSGTLATLKAHFQSVTNSILYAGDRLGTLKRFCIILLVIVFVKNLFFYLQNVLSETVLQSVTNRIRKSLFGHIHNLSLAFFGRKRTGEIISRVTNDVQMMQDTIAVSIADLIRDPLQILIYFVFLLVINWRLTLIITAVAPIIVILMGTVGRKLRRYSTRAQERMASLNSVLQESISGVRVVKSFGAESYEKTRFNGEADGYLRTYLKMIRVRRLSGPLNEFIGTLVAVFILWYGGRDVLTLGQPTPAAFMQYIVVLFVIMQPIKGLSDKYNRIQQGLAAASRVFDVIDTIPAITSASDAPVLQSLKDKIEYRNVSFRYPNTNDWALRGINITIKKGQTIALVGRSGAGKSTLADLLIRFYDPQEGSILIDGIDIRDIELSSLRSLMGIVTQETILFNDTVAANIAYGNEKQDMKRIKSCAEAANAMEFIGQLPAGFDTPIGDRGTKLSGGERQRIAIARALYRDPDILIFDEATSSLDSESEKLVQTAIERLLEGRTAIVIAHRLSTVVHSDMILVLDKGEIVERGTHSKLLAKAGLYRELYEHQYLV